jgi:hypothetical protein
LTKKFFPHIPVIRGMTFEFDYLGKFKLLGYEPRDHEGAFDERKNFRESVPLSSKTCFDPFYCKFKSMLKKTGTIKRFTTLMNCN